MDSAGRRPHSSAFSQQDHKKILNGHELKKGSNGHELKRGPSGHELKKGLNGHELKKAPNGHELKKAPNGHDLKKVLNGQDLLTRGAHRRFSTAPRVASKIQFLKKLKLKERDQQPLVLLQRLEQYIEDKFIRQLYTWGSLTVLKTTNTKPKPRRKKLEIFKVVSSEYYKERNVPLTNKNSKPDAKVEENSLFESSVEKKLTDFTDSKTSITNGPNHSSTSKQKLTHKSHSTSKNSKFSTSRQNSKDLTNSLNKCKQTSSKTKCSSEFHSSERQNPKFRSSSDRLRQASKSSNYFSDRPKHSSRLSDCYRDKPNSKFKDCSLDKKDSKLSVSSLITKNTNSKVPNVCSKNEVITSSDDCFRNKQVNSKSEIYITNKEISDTDICSHDKINSKYSARSLGKVNPNLNNSFKDILKTEFSVSFPDKLNSKSSVCSPDTLISKSSENSSDKVNSISSNSSTNKLKTKPKLCFTNKIHLKSSVCSSDKIKNISNVQSLNKQNSEFSASDNQISKLSIVSNEKLNSETFTNNVNSKSSAVNSKSNLSAVDKCNAKPISSVFIDRSEQNSKRSNGQVVAEASSITSCAEFNNSDAIETNENTKTINNNKNNNNASFLNNKNSNKITAMKNNIPESVYNNNNNNANSNNNNSKRNTCSFIKSSIKYFNYNSKYKPINPYPVSDNPDTASSLMKPMPELESFSEDPDIPLTGSNGKEDKSAVSSIEEDNSNSANISSDGHVTNISKKGRHTNISNDDHVTNIHRKDRRPNIFRKDGNTNISENDNNAPVGLRNEDKKEIENEGEIYNDHSFICSSSHQPNNQKFDGGATTPVEAPANENNICCSSAAAAAATNNGSSSHKCDSARRDESKHSRTQSGRPNSPTFECRKKESPRSDTGIPKIILYLKGKGPDKQYTCASNIPTKTSDSVIMPSKGLVSNHSAKNIVKSLKIKSEDSEDKNNKIKVNIDNEQCDKSIVNNDSSLKIEDDMPVAIPIEDSDKDNNDRKRLEENISNTTNDSSSNHSFSDSLPDLELLADQCEDSHSSETKKNDSQTDKIKITESDTLIRGSKISLSTYKNLGKPTAHVEPYIAEPTLRSSSRKGKGFYDEDIPFLIEQEEPDIYEDQDFEEQSEDPKNESSTLNSVPDWDEYSENPQNEYSKSPQNEYSKSPQNEFSKSPKIEYLKSPQSEYSRSPQRRSKNNFSNSPKEFSKKSPNEYSNQHDKYSEIIQNEYCKSPNNEYVKNSNKYSKGFHNIYSKSPADEYLNSPVNHSNFVSSHCDKTTEGKTLRSRSSSQLPKCLCQKSGEISDPVPNCPVHKMGMLSPLRAEKNDEDTTNSISSLPRYNSCVSDGEIKTYPSMNTFLGRQHTQERKMEYYTPNLYREMCNHEATAEEKFLINCPRSLKRLSRIRNLNSSSKERPRSLSIDSALSLFTVRVENSALMFPLKKSSSLINFKPNHYMSCSTIRRESIDQTTTTTTTSSSSVPSEGETSGGEESEMYVIENKSDFYLDVQDEVVKFDYKQIDTPLEPENENPQQQKQKQQNPPPHKYPSEKTGLHHPPDDKGLKRTLKQMKRERKKLKNKEKNMEQIGAQDPDNGGSNSKIGTNLPEKKIRKKNKRITEQGDASDQEVKKYVEREKGFRLAQEIPGFNWLEEKIRNSTIPILPGVVTTTASTTYTTCVTTFVTNTTALVTQNVCALPNKATRSLSSPAANPDSTQMVQAKSMPELLPATEYVPIKQSILTMPREMTQSVKSPPETIKIRANFGGTNLFIPATRGPNSLISTTGGANTIIPSTNGSTVLIPSSNFIIPTTGISISTTGISIPSPGNNIPGSGINIPGSGINIQGSGINIPASGINIPGSGINIPESGINIPGSGINIPGSGINIPGSGINPGSGIKFPGSGINIPGSGVSISSTGLAITSTGMIIPSTGICFSTTGVPIGSNQFVKELHRQQSEPKDLFKNGQIDVITCEPKSFMHLQTAVTQLAPTLKALPKLRPSPPNSSNNLLPITTSAITTSANTTINTTAQDKTISSNPINPSCAPRPHYTSSVITSTASYNPSTRADVTTLSSTISQPVTAPAVQKWPINVHETQPEPNRSKTGEEKSKISTDKCSTVPVLCDTENSSPMEIEESDSGNAEKSFGPKLSILKEAFKNKLSVLQDDPVESVSPDSSKKSEVDKPVACEASTSQVVPQEKVISNKVGQSTSDIKIIKCDEPRKLSEGVKGFADLIEEVEKPVLISIPETLPSIESVLSGIKVGDGMQENILGKTANKEFETQSLFAALYEELLKTRKEVEKLRKMQEQMLQSDVMKKSVQKVDPKSESEDDQSIKSEPLVIDITIGDNSQPSSEKATSEPKSGRDSATKRTSESLKEPAEPKFIYKVLGAEAEKPHSEPLVQDEYGNPKKKFKSGNEGVTKHYSDAKHDHQEGGHIDARKSDPHNSRLRDLLGISNSELDVVPIEESVTFQSVLSARVPTTSTAPTSTNQDTSTITSCSSSMQPTSLYYTKEPDRLRVVVPVSQEYVNSLNAHQRRSVGEIPSLIPSTPPVRRCSEDYGREHDSRLMKLATALPNSTLRPKHFGGHPAGPPQGVIVSDHSRMHLQPNRHIRPTIMTVSEPQPLMSHHPVPILSQSQAKFMNDRRVIMQKSHQPPPPDLNMDGERKLYVQQYVSPPPNPGRDLNNGGIVSNVGMKNLQTVQTFQPKIIIPQDKEMTSSSLELNPAVQNALQESVLQNSGIPISIGLQNSGLTGGLLNSQSNLSSMPSVSHSFSNIVKRPSAFTSNQNYSYKQNPASARLAEIFPIVQQQHPMSNQGKSYHQIQSQPPSHISDQHYGSQQIIQVDRSTGNVISTQHGPVPLSPKISQSHGHGQFYPPHSLSQKIMHHTPLVHTVPSHTYPHSSQVHPSYNLGQHRPNAQLVEGSLQHSGNYHHDQHNNGSPNRPHIISPSLPKHRPPNLQQGYPNISNYQGPPVSSKQISPNQSHSPNRISPHMQSPSGYPNRIQIPMQISPHHPSNQTRMNPPPPYRVPSPTKPLMVNHHQKMMMQQQADAQGHTNPSVIAGARKPYPNEKQIQMVQVHPMANGVRDAGDYSNQSPTVGTSNSSPPSTAKKKCLICPQSAQFLCSGCKTAWYCSKECQRQHWALHSPNCVIRR